MNVKVAEVIIQESESLENALRRFKRKVQQEDIIKEIKKHSFYMKPGEKRRASAESGPQLEIHVPQGPPIAHVLLLGVLLLVFLEVVLAFLAKGRGS